jgi:hypothetical protein
MNRQKLLAQQQFDQIHPVKRPAIFCRASYRTRRRAELANLSAMTVPGSNWQDAGTRPAIDLVSLEAVGRSESQQNTGRISRIPT